MNNKSFFTPHIYKSIFIVLTLLFAACSNDDNAVADNTDDMEQTDDDMDQTDNDDNDGMEELLPNIVELAQSVDDLSLLVAALTTNNDLVAALSAEGENTVFAPSNAAFGTLLGQLDAFESLDDFDEETELALLTEILKYHVISNESTFSDNLSDQTELETLQTESLTILVDGNVFIQDKTEDLAEVIGADNEASNGVVHVIDKILLPQAVLDQLFPKPSIVELVTETEELSLLEEALIKAGLVDALSAEGPFTVFAPTNAAADGLFTALGDSFNSFDDFDNFIEIEILKQILLYHVVDSNIMSTDLTAGTIPTLLTDESIEIIASGDTFVVGDASDVDANILSADNEASNGVVHIIDKILIPTEVQEFLDSLNEVQGKTIAELVEETEGFTFLKEALELTGLLETLDSEGPFTVFAPTDDALSGLLAVFGSQFTSIQDFTSEEEIALLRQVLLYHVLPGTTTSSDLSVATINTLSGDNTLDVVTTESGFGLVDVLQVPAAIEITDIPAKNGVIHTIDRVLLPQSVIETIAMDINETLIDVIAAVEDSEFVQDLFVLLEEEFNDAIQQEFTFFLPTNNAFLDLFASLDGYDSLADFNTVQDLELLTTILSYHLIERSTLTSNVLMDGQSAGTFQGESVSVSLSNGVSIVDKTGHPANVTTADVEVLKGVIHFIDKVLLPQEVLDAL
ncbi:fasciclin domain-containing protein [Croceitalea rosinachiae]|uniref:Fasciclin domain-containing protein n=1 Tax=Croceitalea rosinachiae TaxID=3075596 RepID=A0ABU3AB82_9FLAO|nr:fasciclin domain-containing protein [Croceitalea sp. F388]MDT0607435.1 fasciclin domain-containing protein [Croceitalea sp. F388]